MKANYSIRIDVIQDGDRKRTAYGLDIKPHGISIPDIFTDRKPAEQLADACNRLDVSPIHIYEIIEDIL